MAMFCAISARGSLPYSNGSRKLLNALPKSTKPPMPIFDNCRSQNVPYSFASALKLYRHSTLPSRSEPLPINCPTNANSGKAVLCSPVRTRKSRTFQPRTLLLPPAKKWRSIGTNVWFALSKMVCPPRILAAKTICLESDSNQRTSAERRTNADAPGGTAPSTEKSRK